VLFDALYDAFPSGHPQVLVFCPVISCGVPHPLVWLQSIPRPSMPTCNNPQQVFFFVFDPFLPNPQ
jgi:hypothetical protein